VVEGRDVPPLGRTTVCNGRQEFDQRDQGIKISNRFRRRSV
jgi:hypothetical protein